MKVLAIYAVNQHIADLMAEAHHARMARRQAPKPSPVRRLLAAIRSIVRPADATPALAA